MWDEPTAANYITTTNSGSTIDVPDIPTYPSRLRSGYSQILPERQYPLRLHADDVALLVRLEGSNRKLLQALERLERLVGRMYDSGRLGERS